jgi:hypothetical protein
MQLNMSCRRYVRIGFACLGALALLDVVLLLSTEEYRNALGVTPGVFDSFNLGRIILDVLMSVFYWMVYVKIREGRVLSSLMVWHGLLYGLLGAALCFLPWGGLFLAPLTPVGVLYLGAILWTPFQLPGALGVAVAFVAFNTYLVRAGLTSGKLQKKVPG